MFDWYPKYQSCLRYFHEHAQHTDAAQAVSASVNIKLPFQLANSHVGDPHGSGSDPQQAATAIVTSLVPYVRRLVATGFDSPAVLEGLFGDDWHEGIGTIHENERRNYLFAAKSETWLNVKASYDMDNGQSVPFLKPLQGATEKEIQAAETNWSEWLAMQDWMVGPRALMSDGSSRGSR